MALAIRKMAGYSGGEGCVRCHMVNSGTRHYGQEITITDPAGDIHGFSGYRGPYCSAKCYRLDYPGDGQDYVRSEAP